MAPQSDIDRYKANRGSDDVLSFRCAAGDSIPGHPSRPVLDRQSALRYSRHLQQLLQDEPWIGIIEYHEQEACVVIGRYIACISPSIRSEVPIFDICEVEKNGASKLMAIPIQWTAQELQGLYCFARYMDSDDVCDMVLDRWHRELRQVGRQTRTESGELATFEILDVTPEFLNLLAEHDPKALQFFIDVIVAKGGVGWTLLNTHGLAKWDDGVKQVLIEKLATRKWGVVRDEDREKFCRSYHHHDREAECYRDQAGASPATTASKLAENLTSRTMRAAGSSDSYRFWWESRVNGDGLTKRDSAGGDCEEHAAKCQREEALQDEEDDMKSSTIDLVMGVFASTPSDHHDAVEDDGVISRPSESTREPVPDRIQYGGKWGVVLDGYTNESKAIFDRKCRIMEARVQRYINAGIDVGEIPGRDRVKRALEASGVTQADLDLDAFDCDD